MKFLRRIFRRRPPEHLVRARQDAIFAYEWARIFGNEDFLNDATRDLLFANHTLDQWKIGEKV